MNYFCQFDSSTNELIGLPQTVTPKNSSGWYAVSLVEEGFLDTNQSFSYALENNIIVQSITTHNSFDYSPLNRSLRNTLLQETTMQGWGDTDYRATQSSETVAAWDAYRTALRNLPTTLSTFASAEITDSDLPTKP
jgi:hypothetical protein|tara:strand:+ start:274 stop:681 length:408 start_codon:yes stop_codon:yes gene_type:complete